jgi:hypothetical protein
VFLAILSSPETISLIPLPTWLDCIVSLSQRADLKSVLAPTGEILSFALPKESIQRKGNPDAALILRAEDFDGGCLKGPPSPCKQRDASLHRPCWANPAKTSGARRGITGENLAVKVTVIIVNFVVCRPE